MHGQNFRGCRRPHEAGSGRRALESGRGLRSENSQQSQDNADGKRGSIRRDQHVEQNAPSFHPQKACGIDLVCVNF